MSVRSFDEIDGRRVVEFSVSKISAEFVDALRTWKTLGIGLGTSRRRSNFHPPVVGFPPQAPAYPAIGVILMGSQEWKLLEKSPRASHERISPFSSVGVEAGGGPSTPRFDMKA